MNLENKLRKSKVSIITHTFATGPGQELETYLKDKTKRLIFIGHPLPFCKDLRSVFREYNCKNKLVKEKKGVGFHLPSIFLYFKDVFYTFWWLITVSKSDLVVGIDGLNAFCGLILKKLGKTKKVIFYTIDYVPQRFENFFLNKLYHFLDSFCVRHCDLVWNLSPVMIEEREKKGVEKKYRQKQITVPIGTDLNVKRLSFEKINRYEIAFMGHLREGQGVEMLIESLPEVLKEIPKAKLILIGTGPLEQKLRTMVSKLGIKEKVEFTGFIESHNEMQNRLAKCAIAVAPYVDDEKGYTRYTDPGKPKAYLAAGLPVIITNIVQVAKEIDKAQCGKAIGFSKKELVRAIIDLLKDEGKLKLYRKNTIEFAKKFEWEKIFYDILKRSINQIHEI